MTGRRNAEILPSKQRIVKVRNPPNKRQGIEKPGHDQAAGPLQSDDSQWRTVDFQLLGKSLSSAI
jgi:hypothetical protein